MLFDTEREETKIYFLKQYMLPQKRGRMWDLTMSSLERIYWVHRDGVARDGVVIYACVGTSQNCHVVRLVHEEMSVRKGQCTRKAVAERYMQAQQEMLCRVVSA